MGTGKTSHYIIHLSVASRRKIQVVIPNVLQAKDAYKSLSKAK